MNQPAQKPPTVRLSVAVLGVLVVGMGLAMAIYRHDHPASDSAPFATPSAVVQSPSATVSSLLPAPATTQSTAPANPSAYVVSINRSVSAGTLLIDIQAMECGVTTIGAAGAELAAPSGAQWCLVRVEVTNKGSSSFTFSAASPLAFDSKGDKFSADNNAVLYVSNPFLTLNPGVSGLDVVPFQLAMGTRLTSLEFYGPDPLTPVSVSI